MADHLSVAVWVAPGRAEYVAAARRWAQSVSAAWGVAGAEVGLVVSELVTNALRHTRSGRPGGTVVVAVAEGWDSVTVHVHDLGAGLGQVPRPRQAARDAEGGRGLAIVIAVSAEWGIIPAAWCPVQRADDPAVDTGGCCTWCRLVSGLAQDEKESRDG
jgi:anti-sigma regulatory factor (Ser/Thr protein kinase)